MARRRGGDILSAAAVILLSHGSRAPGANEPVATIRRLVQKQLPQAIVQEAFLSFASPTFTEAVGRAVDQGARRIIVAPLFLWSGRHLQEHLPQLLAGEQQRWQGRVDIVCAAAIGPDPRLADILLERVEEVAHGILK